jgi:hypothetical protein
LTALRIIPSKKDGESRVIGQPDWSPLFEAAGLDLAKYTAVEPEAIPPLYADMRSAWTGTLPDFPGTAVRIEAAVFRGKPVFWSMIVPFWDNYSTGNISSPRVGASGALAGIIGPIALIFFALLLLAGPAFFARRNLRLGRGDRTGAARMACFTVCVLGAAWLFGEHHLGLLEELFQFVFSAAIWIFTAGWIWVLYVALEPYARRRWPRMLVGWSRLLVGFLTINSWLLLLFPAVILWVPVDIPPLNPFSGAHVAIATILESVVESIFTGLAAAFMIFMLRILLRRTWAAAIIAAGFVFLIMLMIVKFIMPSLLGFIPLIVLMGAFFFVLTRFGLLSLIAMIFFYAIRLTLPNIIQLSVWYSWIGLTGPGIMLAFVLYAFHTSLGGQPMFGRASLED